MPHRCRPRSPAALLLAALAVSALLLSPPAASAAPPPAAGEGDHILLLLRAGAVPPGTLELDLRRQPASPVAADLDSALRALGVERLERLVQRPLDLPPVLPEMVPEGHAEPYHVERLFLLRLPPGADVAAALERLNKLPSVVIAERSGEVKAISPPAVGPRSTAAALLGQLLLFPNDPMWSWGLDVVGARTAWSYQTGRSSVRIAFLDSGGETVHPDLAGKVVAGYDFVHGDSNFHPDLGILSPSHGMGVAGIAAALTNNAAAIPGLCGGDGVDPGCGVLMPKILGDRSIFEWVGKGLAWLGNHHLSVDAVYWSLDHGADVLSNSWCSSGSLPFTVHAAFREAYRRGVLSVAAMGNSDGECGQDAPNQAVPPASYSDVFTSVGAVDSAQNRVVTSLWQSATGPHIDLAAPGLGVPSLELGGGTAVTQSFSGTSAATPFVAGAMGLVLSEIEERGLPLAHYDVPHLLRLTAKDRGPVGHDVEYGAGIVDVGKALTVLQPPYVIASGTAGPASGCHSRTGIQQWVFLSDFALYLARRCEVRRNVSFGQTYQSPPLVWGRPLGDGGITPSNPNGQLTWTGVVPGTVTTTGATLRTYVYERWSLSGQFLGWYPAPPNQVSFAWALVGIPGQPPPPPPPPPPTNPCANFDFSQCEGLYQCEFQCVIGTSGPIGHECCACQCTSFSACPICLMPN